MSFAVDEFGADTDEIEIGAVSLEAEDVAAEGKELGSVVIDVVLVNFELVLCYLSTPLVDDA